MKYLSVCSGIEAATVAWHPLGWESVAFSEIEPFPSAVLAHHYPQVPNLGDMTKHKEWNLGTIDLLVGGTPCQSFSVAGLRKGLDDPRGNLMLTYLAIADRNRPTWLVWENVPGVLSSNGGKDFGTFLGGLGELGYGFAYRVLDAQYFGVAQRRRRVFVVGYLGDWRPAAAVLFERESVCGNPAPSREKGKATAGAVTTRSGNSSARGIGTDEACGGYLQAAYGIPGNWIGRQPENGGNSTQFMEEVAPCLTSADKHGVAQTFDMKQHHNPQASNTVQLTTKNSAFVRGDTPLVAQPIPINSMNAMRSPDAAASTGCGIGDEGEAMFTITKGNHHAVAQPMAFTQNTRDEVRWINGDGQIAGALAAEAGMKQTNYVAQPMAFEENFNAIREVDIAPAMTTEGYRVSQNAGGLGLRIAMKVRRLTPVECERLQGFPDNYTNIPWRKQPESPDGPRYKALGNSMAVPVMAWIGKRIAEYEQQAVSG